ncbi:MAG: N-formylglutamate amidohydrolase [Hyphomicrobiaceae bacterium]|nr:N-formylglutamate amidohydrolase [Hyphomicrobiaceae bacterium]
MASLEQKTIDDCFTPSFTLVQPAQETCPYIFSSPHSGRTYPPAFLKASRLSALQLRSSEDAFVDELFSHVTDQGAWYLKALVPRAYLDLNRHPHELDPKLFDEKMPDYALTSSTKVKSGLGVIARIVSEGCEIYKHPLALSDALTRINHLYFPYHKALGALIETVKKNHKRVVLIDCHSMPSNNLPGFRDVPPDFVLGNRFDKSCDYELTHFVRAQLQAMGYVVAVNKPYAGGYVTRQYGKPQKDVHALQIEINRRLYLDERCMKKTAGFNKLQKNLCKLTQKLISARPDRSLATPLAAE